jgi:transposase
MIKNKDSLKAKVNNISKEYNIPNKYLIQDYMFEEILKRMKEEEDKKAIEAPKTKEDKPKQQNKVRTVSLCAGPF